MKSKQSGITLIGFLIALVVSAFFIFIGIRLFPVFSEYYSVRESMDEIAKQPNIGSASRRDIEKFLYNRFNIGYVESVDLKKDVSLTRSAQGQELNIKYEVRKPFAYNIDFVAKFDYTVTLKSN